MATSQVCVAFIVLCVVTLTSGFPERRSKRSVLQLCSLMAHHGAEGCLRYNGYGCYCGYGNAGEDKEPADDTDRCCQKHDKCYGELSKSCSGMWFAQPQLITYQFNCSGPDRWKYHCKCKDKRSEAPCARSVCDCDLQMARCLERSKFNPEFENHDHSKCKPKVKHHRKSLRELRLFRHRKRNRKGRRNRRARRKHGDRKNKRNNHKRDKKHKKKTKKQKTTAVDKSSSKSEKSSYWSKWFGWIG